MCGISGFVSNELDNSVIAETVKSMSDQIKHRGRDNSGIWIDKNIGIALAHQRLSIVDLSMAGAQPMISYCGRYYIVFNGEIYNHLDIRNEIQEAIKWKGHSDTETLINAISYFGIEKTLQRVTGMFSFALWDRRSKNLTLAKDRIGEKPLYYGFSGKSLVFASELKAILKFPNFSRIIDRNALSLYFQFGYIPAGYSIYKDISKLIPGTFITFSMKDIKYKIIPKYNQYWSFNQISLNQFNKPFIGSETAAINKLEILLEKSIKSQLIGDVPIGAFLSGGIDSTTVVSLMQNLSSKPVQTFTVGFNEKIYDESFKAKNVSKYLGTIHNEIFLSSEEAKNIIPILPDIYDEPFSDVSQIPTYLISKLSSEKVKVCLSGDGGDELFCGYNRHLLIPKLWNILKRIPIPLRNFIAIFIRLIPQSTWDNFYYYFKIFLPKYLQLNNPTLKFHKLSDIICSQTLFDIYLCLVSSWDSSSTISNHFTNLILGKQFDFTNYSKHNPEHQMMLLDSISYLPNDILVKVDRAAMYSSLETRMPMLDNKIIEFAWSIPLSMKIKNNQSKWILKELLNRYIPQNIIEGPKSGFSVPIAEWLRGPLKEWANELLDSKLIYSQKYLSPKIIRKKWHEHLSGNKDWSSQLWTILMFQAWAQRNIHS